MKYPKWPIYATSLHRPKFDQKRNCPPSKAWCVGGGLIWTMPKRIGVILLGYLSIAAPPLAPTPHPCIFLQLGHFVGCQQNTMFREKGFFSHEHLLKPIISSTNDHLCIAKLLSHPFWWLKLSSLILSSKQTDFVVCNYYITFQTLILIQQYRTP